MLIARVPDSSRTSTVSIRGMLDTSAIFFLMYSFSVAFWKYFDFAILSTNRKIFLLVLTPVCLWGDKTGQWYKPISSVSKLVNLIFHKCPFTPQRLSYLPLRPESHREDLRLHQKSRRWTTLHRCQPAQTVWAWSWKMPQKVDIEHTPLGLGHSEQQETGLTSLVGSPGRCELHPPLLYPACTGSSSSPRTSEGSQCTPSAAPATGLVEKPENRLVSNSADTTGSTDPD